MGKDNELWVDTFETADLDGSTTNANVRVHSLNNQYITCARAWIVFYNNPTFTNLTAELYSDREGVPGKLIATATNSWTMAQFAAEGFDGLQLCLDIPFLFDKVSLREQEYYHLVLHAPGYVGSESSFIAWRKGWPDNIYPTGEEVTFNSLSLAPRLVCFVGARF